MTNLTLATTAAVCPQSRSFWAAMPSAAVHNSNDAALIGAPAVTGRRRYGAKPAAPPRRTPR